MRLCGSTPCFSTATVVTRTRTLHICTLPAHVNTSVWTRFQVKRRSAWSVRLFISISGHRCSAKSGTLLSAWDVTLRFPALGRGLCTPIYFIAFLSLLSTISSSVLLHNSRVELFDCVQKHRYLNRNLSLSVFEFAFNRHAEILGLWSPRRLHFLRHLILHN